MAKKRKNIQISEAEFDHLLGSFGYLFPRNDNELEIFEEVYSNYSFKLKDVKIDFNEIIEESFKKSTRVIPMSENIDKDEIESLRMAARKGIDQLDPKILKRIRDKHKNKDE